MSRQPTIEWQVAGACNYDCSYCIQSARYRRGALDVQRAQLALAFFATLPGSWEIKCSGGEAFAHRAFIDDVVPQLMQRTAHRISVLTNFSASRRDLMRFAAATRGRLEVFSASLHLEFVALDDFVSKARWFVDLLDPSVRFVVNQVVLPGREQDAARCRDRLAHDGIRWFPQLYKVKGGVAPYPDAEALRALVGDAPSATEANVAPSYRGRRCWAGVEYLVVDKEGDVYACRTAKRHGEGHLGNIFADPGAVKRLAAPAICGYDICPCTVPANRGMIEGVGPAAAALDDETAHHDEAASA
ncbi:MAG: radical SAM protein [Myxococcales bacterium]|nr:radical SAM protein [Myxococcales bacterium]